MPSHTLESIPPYVFWELDARRNAHRAQGRTLIDLGIGSPDQAIPAVVVEAMQRYAADRALSGYPHFTGSPEFSGAVARFMHERFGVTVDPSQDVLALAGSKEGIAELVLAHCNAGDVVLVPEIFYPVYARSAQLAGATPVFVPMDAHGLLDLEAIAPTDLARARILIVNYPCNHTTATITLSEFERLVAFAERHDVLLVSDLAYSELSYDGYVVPSVLQVPGASRVAVELHSCSKSFNMAGIRVAFVTGQREAIRTLDQYRSNIGYGLSSFAQVAGAAAFTHHASIIGPIVAEYRARRDALVAAFRAQGWPVTPPRATMYLWLDVPAALDDWAWVEALMSGPGIVITPGVAFGEAGRGHFRISLVQPASVLTAAAARIVETAAAMAVTSRSTPPQAMILTSPA